MKFNASRPYALLSVSNKAALGGLARALVDAGYALLSTGGTARFLLEEGLEVTTVSDVTSFPEMMEGRVKTLHPRIHGGLLGRRDVEADVEAMRNHGVADIRVVVVNLYPFETTVASGATETACIENIDIGGPAMVRAAAKNFAHVSVLVDPADYDGFARSLPEGPGLDERRALAAKAFAHTAAYDAAVAGWFDPSFAASPRRKVADLRYGENPHQNAALWRGLLDAPLGGWQVLQGKELSYNNLVDADAAVQLVAEFDKPACAIIKHTNPAGVACADDVADAFSAALAADPVSAFGGIVALNRSVTLEVAERLAPTFWEVVIAPDFDAGARELLGTKKALRLLCGSPELPTRTGRQTVFGWVEQQADPAVTLSADDLVWVTKRTAPELAASLLFAWRVCKHVKSNAIVLARGEVAVGVGAGQMSRVDAVRLATERQRDDHSDAPLILASDAFFPFRDGVDLAAQAGVVAIIQPGGSKRDDEVIAACDAHGIAMAVTGRRHFRH